MPRSDDASSVAAELRSEQELAHVGCGDFDRVRQCLPHLRCGRVQSACAIGPCGDGDALSGMLATTVSG